MTATVGPLLSIEPPPSLPGGHETMGYCAYALPQNQAPVLLGEIVGKADGAMTLSQAPTSLDTPALIGVTRLCPGRDRVIIPARAHWDR